MGVITNISWCDHTYNPWIGCMKVSEGCKFCYAEIFANNRMGRFGKLWGANSDRHLTKTSNDPVKWDKAAKKEGIRKRIFCGSMMDVFEDNDLVLERRKELFELIKKTPNLDWLLLTKRPKNINKFLPEDWSEDGYENIWLGTTVENQQSANERIPFLLSVPAKIHFLSCEPLLGEVNLRKLIIGSDVLFGVPKECALYEEFDCLGVDHSEFTFAVDWVIVGGESGNTGQYRECRLKWIYEIVDQCKEANVAVFVKQMGTFIAKELDIKDKKHGANKEEFLNHLQLQEFPK